MSYFSEFKRKAVVVIPPHHELRKRVAKRTDEMGSPLPPDAIDAMKGGCGMWEGRGGGCCLCYVSVMCLLPSHVLHMCL